MSGKREIACGVDAHNKFIVATILSSDGLKLQNRFETCLEDLLKFKNWLKENGCHKSPWNLQAITGFRFTMF